MFDFLVRQMEFRHFHHWLRCASAAAALGAWGCFSPLPTGAAANDQGFKSGQPALTAPRDQVFDLTGRSVDPLQAAAKVTVLIFVNPECPISNRYAPEIQRLAKAFVEKGATFWLVYPDAGLSPETIRKHLKEFGYSLPALRDPHHFLVKQSQAKVTPEAAVFNAKGRLLYNGRIDNRYVDFGKERFAPTERDLENAIKACLANQPVSRATTKAIGCYISE
jgi:hypothetical protein